MEVTAVVLYRGALAYYTVAVTKENGYAACLLRYSGDPKNQPPQRIAFLKKGRRCEGDTDEQDLMDDLCDAVQQQLSGADPHLSDRNPKAPYVAI